MAYWQWIGTRNDSNCHQKRIKKDQGPDSIDFWNPHENPHEKHHENPHENPHDISAKYTFFQSSQDHPDSIGQKSSWKSSWNWNLVFIICMNFWWWVKASLLFREDFHEDFHDVFREDFREDFKSQLNRAPGTPGGRGLPSETLISIYQHLGITRQTDSQVTLSSTFLSGNCALW